MAEYADLQNVDPTCDDGQILEPNNLFGSLITQFDVGFVKAESDQGGCTKVELIPNITNRSSNHPEGAEISVQNEDFGGSENDEGEAIMAGLTGFGAKLNNSPMFDNHMAGQNNQKAFVVINEHPAGNRLRFRYQCEGRSAGALQGANSSSDHRTYPSIEIVGYKGPAVVVVSCIEEKPPFRTHPHNLVGKMCKKGVCSMDINVTDMTCVFQNLGVQCVKKKDAPESLKQREQIRVDPFKQGFKHKTAINVVNLNAIRLCFQVFLKIGEGKLYPLDPVVSNVIRDKKAYSDLQIVDHSDDTSPVEGKKKILLFCEKVYRDDIEVRFSYENENGDHQILKGDFSANDVHKQHGISFKTPRFPDQFITERVKVQMYLYKPSENAGSEPVDFYYEPSQAGDENVAPAKQRSGQKRNKKKNTQDDDDPSSRVRAIPPKFRASGGNVTVAETKAEVKEPLMVDKLFNSTTLMGPPQQIMTQDIMYNTNFNNLNAPRCQEAVKIVGMMGNDDVQQLIMTNQGDVQYQNFDQQDYLPVNPSASSDGFLDINLSQVPSIDPGIFEISSEFSDMKMSEEKNQLNTPDISCEQK